MRRNLEKIYNVLQVIIDTSEVDEGMTFDDSWFSEIDRFKKHLQFVLDGKFAKLSIRQSSYGSGTISLSPTWKGHCFHDLYHEYQKSAKESGDSDPKTIALHVALLAFPYGRTEKRKRT